MTQPYPQPGQDEIDDLLNDCAESADSGRSKFPGMTYEQGVEAAVRWMAGETDSHPLSE